MLRKLLKYEFKATARIFPLMYAALLIVATINALLLPFSDNALSNLLDAVPTLRDIIYSLSSLTYTIALVAVTVLTAVVIVVRFYRMLGDEGYLWFTLPVNADQQLIAKLICALVWWLATALAVTISVLILALPELITDDFISLRDFIQILFGYPGVTLSWFATLTFYLISACIYSPLIFFMAMSIGPNLTKSRLGGSVLAYVIIYIALQVVGVIRLLFLTGPILSFADNMTTSADYYDISGILQIFLNSYSVINLLLAVGFYFITRYFLKNKLNLT